MAKSNYKYGVLDENNKLTYAPYKLHYGKKYVINGSEIKYRACGYYPVKTDTFPTDKLEDNQYYDCRYKYVDNGENQKYIRCYFVIANVAE